MLANVSQFFLTLIREQKNKLSNFSFGAVSAVITSLALIVSLNTNEKAKLGVIGSLCVIALADNVSDTLGIHIYQEGEYSSFRKVWRATLMNFVTRLCVIIIFILFVLGFSPLLASVFSILYGFLILTVISYLVAQKRYLAPKTIILEHLIIATLVLVISKYITYLIKLWI
jgi:hypothetical protein